MTFQMVKQIVSSIISAVEQTGIAGVKSLKAHTFTVKVANNPPLQKIEGTVKVSNPATKDLLDLKKSITELLKTVRAFRFPKKIEVSNFPKIPAFPSEIKVSNFPAFPKPPDFPSEIKISNPVSLEEAHEYLRNINRSIKDLKLDPKITVQAPKPERVIVPPANVTVTQKEIDYDKLATAIADKTKGIDYERLAKQLAKEIEPLVVTSSVGGGGGGKAFSYSNGQADKALLDDQRRLVVSPAEDDLTRKYQVADKDAGGTPKYYGFSDADGAWYILKEENDTYRYARGASDYPGAWTGRASQDYDYFHVKF